MIIKIQCPTCLRVQERNVELSYRVSEKFECNNPKCKIKFTHRIPYYQNKITAFVELSEELKSIRF